MFFDNTIQSIKNLNRAREIIQVLLKYGFEDIVINTPLKLLIPESRRLTWLRQTKPVFDYSRWERLRLATEELGPTFIKFAQVLSNRPDILPLPLIKEFEKLQSEVPPFSVEQARLIIETEINGKIEEHFEYFLDKPIGSASIGQVHRAKIHGGEEVVIKVQRPGINSVVSTDISIMKEIARRTETYLKRHDITNVLGVVEAFDKVMQRELDYTQEARNMLQFKNHYQEADYFYVPTVFKEYCTHRILTSEYISGCKITDIKTIESWGLEPIELAEKGIHIYLTQIFKQGLFHADPHPGNVLVRKDGVICLIDYGMVGHLMKKDKFAFAGIFVGMAQRDSRKVATSLRQLAIEDNVPNVRLFESELSEIVEDYAGMNLKDSSFTEIGTRLQRLLYKHQIRIPGSIFLILRALAILEGIGKQIHPSLDIYALVRPYGIGIIQEQFSSGNLKEELLYRFLQLDNIAGKLPVELMEVLRRTRKGELEVKVQHENYEYLTQILERLTNRFLLTLLIVTFSISSSLMMLSPHFASSSISSYGIPYVSIIGFLMAALLTFLLLFSMGIGRKK